MSKLTIPRLWWASAAIVALEIAVVGVMWRFC